VKIFKYRPLALQEYLENEALVCRRVLWGQQRLFEASMVFKLLQIGVCNVF